MQWYVELSLHVPSEALDGWCRAAEREESLKMKRRCHQMTCHPEDVSQQQRFTSASELLADRSST